MQLLPSTAKWVTGLSSWKGSKNPALTDPQDSLELGACYLSYLLRTFGDTTTALAAYNAGQNNVRNWIKAVGGTDTLKPADIRFPETQAFVSRVQHYKALYEKAHPNAFSAKAAQTTGET
jgi:soluble lytic murein transglycosylase